MECLTGDPALKPYSKCIVGAFGHEEDSDRGLENAYIYRERDLKLD